MCSRRVALAFDAGARLSEGIAKVFDNKSITCSDIEHTIDYYSNSRANWVADERVRENRT